MFGKKRGQVWVETAIYTLIGLTVIAILISVASPQIEKIKNKGVVEQTIVALNTLDNKISEVEQAPGNIRIVDFRIAEGSLEINSTNDLIKYTLENTRLELSEPGEEVREANMILKTEEYGSRFNIIIIREYSSKINITYGGAEKSKLLQAGTTPYKIQIENVGDIGPDDKTHIDFDLL